MRSGRARLVNEAVGRFLAPAARGFSVVAGVEHAERIPTCSSKDDALFYAPTQRLAASTQPVPLAHTPCRSNPVCVCCAAQTHRTHAPAEETTRMGPSGALPRRLTQDALSALRRRRTGVGRAVRRPLQAREGRRQRTDVSDSASGTDDSDDEDDGSGGDDITCMEIMTCCWGPRCCVSMCMLLITLVGWSAAITYGL